MKNEVEKLREMGKVNLVVPDLLRVEQFLTYVLDASKTLHFSDSEKMSFGRVYHRLWWYRDKIIRKYFADDERYKKMPTFLFPESRPVAEIDLENLLKKNKDLAGESVLLPEMFESDMVNARESLAKKFSDPSSIKTGEELAPETLSEPEEEQSPEVVEKKLKLSDYKLRFDDEVATLHVGDFITVIFPPFKNEHGVMRQLFSLRKNEPIDWESVYEAMSGVSTDALATRDIEKQRKAVKDAVGAINSRVKEVCNTDSLLIQFKNNSLQRRY